ncbi:MAG: hypothetical protein CME70_01870 [Halobacteriovorax sp.]|nr:hypothetical protein [Halobacteriovorax sp.]|tara:strand:+ start:34562 stop:35032 length:471 start_codon:yes stop_codon:yes gene_type:complete
MILGKNLYSKSSKILNLLRIFNLILPSIWKKSSDKFGNSEIQNEVGAPALTLTDTGGLRCTSCMLCQNICPSFCIKIETFEHAEEEAAPLNFDINILKCTFCGLCEEACPVDAIRMVGPMPMAGHSEQNWIWDKEYLSTYAGELRSKVGEDRPLMP